MTTDDQTRNAGLLRVPAAVSPWWLSADGAPIKAAGVGGASRTTRQLSHKPAFKSTRTQLQPCCIRRISSVLRRCRENASCRSRRGPQKLKTEAGSDLCTRTSQLICSAWKVQIKRSPGQHQQEGRAQRWSHDRDQRRLPTPVSGLKVNVAFLSNVTPQKRTWLLIFTEGLQENQLGRGGTDTRSTFRHPNKAGQIKTED